MPYVAHNTIQNHPAFLVNFYFKFKNQYLIFFEIIFVNQKQKLSYLCISHIYFFGFLLDHSYSSSNENQWHQVGNFFNGHHNNRMNFFLHQSSFSKLSSRETDFEAFLHSSSEKLHRFRFIFSLSYMKCSDAHTVLRYDSA